MTKSAEFFTQFAEKFEATYGFDSRGVFCQVTGKQIGHLMSGEFLDCIESLDDDLETAIDDYAMRVFASLRPSLQWNKLRGDSLTTLSERQPIDTLAYLLNRMFAYRDNLKMPLETKLGYLADRIKLHQHLTQWAAEPFIQDWLYLLLEVDAKIGLDSFKPNWNASDWLLRTHESRTEMLQQFHEAAMKQFAKDEKDRELQTRWFRSGNALAKPAFVKAFLTRKPPAYSKRREARIAKAKDSSMFADILNDLVGGTTPPQEQVKAPESKASFVPAKRPNTAMPMAFRKKVQEV